MQRNYFESVPDDVIIKEILRHLHLDRNFEDLKSILLLDKRFYRLATDPSFWRHKQLIHFPDRETMGENEHRAFRKAWAIEYADLSENELKLMMLAKEDDVENTDVPGLLFLGIGAIDIPTLPALYWANRNKNSKLLSSLYEYIKQAYITDKEGKVIGPHQSPSAIKWGILLGQPIEAIKPFLDKANINEGPLPLSIAALIGRQDVINLLLKEGAVLDPPFTEFYDKRPLYLAAKGGHLAIVKFFLEKGARVDMCHLLYITAKNGHIDVIKFLIEKEGVDFKYYQDFNPLDAAVENNHWNIVTLLLNSGIHSSNALHVAAKFARIEIFEELLRRGFDVNKTLDPSKETPLHGAVLSARLQIIQLLIGKGADINAAKSDQETALHVAMAKYNSAISAKKNKYFQIIKFLVEHGANINALAADKSTPLHLAAGGGHPELVEYLVNRGADVHAITNDHNTPLHFAVQSGSLETVRAILSNCIWADEVNRLGDTPLLEALKYGYTEIVEYLKRFNTRMPQNTFLIDKEGLLLSKNMKRNQSEGTFLLRKREEVNGEISKWFINFPPPIKREFYDHPEIQRWSEYYGEGLSLFFEEKYVMAEEQLLKALGLVQDPSFTYVVYLALGHVYSAMSEKGKAHRCYNDAYQYCSIKSMKITIFIKKGDLFSEALFARNLGRLAPGNAAEYSQSVDCYKTAIKIIQKEDIRDSRLPECYYKIAKLNYAYKNCSGFEVEALQEKINEAIQYFSKAIELNPKNATYYAERGHVYEDNRDFDSALKDYTVAIQLGYRAPEIYFNCGRIYTAEGKIGEAIRDFMAAIALDPADPLEARKYLLGILNQYSDNYLFQSIIVLPASDALKLLRASLNKQTDLGQRMLAQEGKILEKVKEFELVVMYQFKTFEPYKKDSWETHKQESEFGERDEEINHFYVSPQGWFKK